MAANAYLLAAQAPEILSLPPDQRGDAIMDSVAGNLATSMMAFSSRPGTSETLQALKPKLEELWKQANASKGGLGGAPEQLGNSSETPNSSGLPVEPVENTPRPSTTPPIKVAPEPSGSVPPAVIPPQTPETAVTPSSTPPVVTPRIPTPTPPPAEAAPAPNVTAPPAAVPTPPAAKPDDENDTFLGFNKDGNPIYEDGNGIRNTVENGIK